MQGVRLMDMIHKPWPQRCVSVAMPGLGPQFWLNKRSSAEETGSVQLVGDVEEVADVRRWVILQELEVGGEVAGQEALPDKDQHRAAYSEQGFLGATRIT
uniref:Uncharacterized protein n=1 Tax=Zea mays TaxID=4577 RepID=C4J793_MAIZE|nr:unknown [Zea mays]